MAAKIKPEDASRTARGGIKPSELRKIVENINRHKNMASESNGLAGKATQAAAEANALDKTALTTCCKISKWEAPKRQAFLRSLFDYGEKLGFFDEIDAFDDTVGVMEDIVAKARAGEGKAKKPDPAVKSLLDGAPAGSA